MIFINYSQVVAFNQAQIGLFGGSFGVRDKELLESALAVPQSGFGDQYFHEFPFEMAAAYLYHICKNHPFSDGNKRTSLQVCLAFLEVNGYLITASDDALECLVLDTATGKLNKAEITQQLADNCQAI